MKASFDNAAGKYDATFTHSEIGQLQRSAVYLELSGHLKGVQNILEINCGTGEDARWLAQQNMAVTATDLSSKMIAVAQSKGTLDNLTFQVVDINNIRHHFEGKQFDLIFSNFGGLNCLSGPELQDFVQNATKLLSDQGKLALVIMPQNTLWEQLYFLAKAKFSLANRRKKGPIAVNVDGEKVPTYYYNPKDIVTLTNANFEMVAVKPIGFLVPPSYLSPFFKNKKRVVQFLSQLEKAVQHWSFLSKYADHYIIVLQKR